MDKGPAPSTANARERDIETADRYRLAISSLIVRSWRKRRKLTNQTVGDLVCYTEAEPHLEKNGLFDLKPKQCDPIRECSLAESLRRRPDLLIALRNAIQETSSRKEDRERRKVLKQLINSPKRLLDRDGCRALGDAIFAFFCPDDAVVLTTNIRDHEPLAKAVGKKAEKA